MEAKASNFEVIVIEASRNMVIPFFQRSYVWEQEQWEQLFDDLLNSFNTQKEHFLGSIILKRSQGNENNSVVIDGQQRLTTFSILLKALYDNIDGKDDFNSLLFNMDYGKKPIIAHSRLDKELYSKIFSGDEIDSNIKEGILGCYNFFKCKIKEVFKDKIKLDEEILNRDEIRKFMVFIKNSKIWILVNLNSNEDEQQIFDSINSTGVKLTATDIIKNALFAKAMELKTDYETLYKTYWENVFEGEKKEKIDFWDSEVATGRLKRTQSEIFLHAFAIVKGFFDAEQSLDKLSQAYKDKINEFDDKDKIELFLKEIKDYADIYFEFPKIVLRTSKNEKYKATNFTFNNHEWRLFHILKVADVNTIMPLLLKLKYGKDEKVLKECYEILEVFIVSCYVSSATTKDYNKLFAKMTLELDIENPTDSIKKHLQERVTIALPNRSQIENSLKSVSKKLDNKRAKLVLFWIELFRRHSNPNDIKELSYQYELEHLMPQEWKENWANIGINEDNANRLIFQIGNMTLLNKPLNVKISNNKWEIKLKGDGKKEGIKDCADLLITRKDIVENIDIETWNETAIEHRTENLIKEFFEIWDINKLND